MAWVHIRHRVSDYNTWKEVYDLSAGFKRPLGWKRYQIFMVEGDRHDLLVMEEFETVEQAREFLNSPDRRAALQRAGVEGTPEILVLDGLESGTARE